MASASKKTRTKIKPPRVHAPDQHTETWGLFRNAIHEIQHNRTYQLSYEENYRYAYNLVLYKHGDMLYKGVCEEVSKNLDRLAQEVLMPAVPTGGSDPTHRSQEGQQYLQAFRKVWDDHDGSMRKLKDLLKYMDRTYTPHHELPPIYEKGLLIFIEKITDNSIQAPLVHAILDQIRTERDGFVISRSAMKGCVDVFLTLGSPSLYKQILEPAILKETEDFYKTEGRNLLETVDASQYLLRVESRITEEEARTMHYLSSSSNTPLKSLLLTNLLETSLTNILSMPESGLDAMIDGNKIEDLARLYRLFSLVPLGIPSLRKELKSSVESRGAVVNEGMMEPEDEPEASVAPKNKSLEKALVALKWVQEVLDLRDKVMGLLNGPLQGDKSVEAAISEAFESLINRNPQAPEYLSLFIDDHLKKGLKGKTDDEVEAVLDKAVSIFRYLVDKDIFERYYKNHLSKRLLYGRSVSDDAERGMLGKLKVECGYQFTQKMEGMFNDMKVSVDTTEAYKRHIANMETPCVDLGVTVMTMTFWPLTHSTSACTLPPELLQATKLFERFYLSRHSGRKLTWQPALGNADVRVMFGSKKHDVNLPTFALVVLLLFEDTQEGEQLPFEYLQSTSGIPEAELQRTLQSLACGKFKILKKLPPGRDVNPTDKFVFNSGFSSPLQKIKIGILSSKVENIAERKETKDKIDEERRHQTDACIVRIMKDRKTLTHNVLVTEVTQQLASRFHPVPHEIKRRIEALIEREYLERREDRKSYNYLA